MNKRVKSGDFDRYLQETAGYERDFIGEVLKSRRAAWWFAGIGTMLAVLGLAAGVAGLYQEAPPPVVLRVNDATGAVDVVSTMRESESSYGEIVDKYWVNNYILTREGYDWNTLQTQYDATGLFSGAQVQQDYARIYNDIDGRQIKIANRARIIPKVQSITLSADNGTATVRYSTQVLRDNGVRDPVEHWIATLAYRYVQAAMTESQRRVNPLGFQVVSYRVDSELVSP